MGNGRKEGKVESSVRCNQCQILALRKDCEIKTKTLCFVFSNFCLLSGKCFLVFFAVRKKFWGFFQPVFVKQIKKVLYEYSEPIRMFLTLLNRKLLIVQIF